jgi:DNA-binding response OmpR family regulator
MAPTMADYRRLLTLIVERSSDTDNVVWAALELERYTCTHCSNGDEARTTFCRHK